jgi:hypothetical protein
MSYVISLLFSTLLLTVFIVTFLTIFICKTLTTQNVVINQDNQDTSKKELVLNFIHIPKNAGTSMKDVCQNSQGKINYYFHNVDVHDPTINNQLVIIQNPIKRFCSAVSYALSIYSELPQIKTLLEKNVDTPDKWINAWANTEHTDHECVMKEMKNFIHTIGPKKLEYKWTYTPQSEYINDPVCVLLLENLEAELNRLLKLLGVEVELPVKNKTTHKNDYISEENVQFLKDFYQKDFEMYEMYKKMSFEERVKIV